MLIIIAMIDNLINKISSAHTSYNVATKFVNKDNREEISGQVAH
jgi:hypothetical protein